MRFPFTIPILFAIANLHAQDPDAPQYFGGELTMVDHVNRMGILRADRRDDYNKYHQDLPHHFAMLPNGQVYYNGTQASLKDVPIGTHLHGWFHLGPEGEYEVPLSDTNYNAARQNRPNRFSPHSQFSQALRLEDDFTFDQRQGFEWKIVSVNLDEMKLVAERVAATSSKAFDAPGIPEAEALTGPQTFDLTPATQVWLGSQFGELSDLETDQRVLFNRTWATLFGPGEITDLWIGSRSQELATEQRERAWMNNLRRRGVPAVIVDVEHGEQGEGVVTAVFYEALSDPIRPLFQPETTGYIVTASHNWRAHNQVNANKSARYLEISEAEERQRGSSGIRVKFRVYELLEGVRQGRTVRLFPSGWQPVALPIEEDMHLYDIRPGYLEVSPADAWKTPE